MCVRARDGGGRVSAAAFDRLLAKILKEKRCVESFGVFVEWREEANPSPVFFFLLLEFCRERKVTWVPSEDMISGIAASLGCWWDCL